MVGTIEQSKTEKLDYKALAQELRSKKDFWKPKPGKHIIVFLEEPKIVTRIFNEGENDQKVVEQLDCLIEVDGERYGWSFDKGETPASLYGQVILFANSKGKLLGEKITLLVKSDGKKNDYTVMETVTLKTELTTNNKGGSSS